MGPNSSINAAKPSRSICCAAVADGLGRVRVHLDEQRVGTHCNRALAHRAHQRCLTAALAGIDDDRAVRLSLDDGHRGEVERIPRVILERPDAALAEQQVRGSGWPGRTRRRAAIP